MKEAWKVVVGVLCGLLAGGMLFLASRPPRGEAIALFPPPTSAPIFVHVEGAVAQPGVYTLPFGSRVQDAITAAGGTLEGADLASVNLVTLLEDGTKLTIPFMPTESPTSAPQDFSRAQPTITTSSLININTADQATLETLPKIGPSLARAIIEYRQAHGPFKKIEDIMDVPGIGEKIFELIRNLITV